MNRTNRREFYRIPFPDAERPRLVAGLDILEVIDCSEKGICFAPSQGALPEVGQRIEGRLRFPRGVEVSVAGAVVRSDAERVSLELAAGGIPFYVILQEQLYLRRQA